jgi:hypothetical protein
MTGSDYIFSFQTKSNAFWQVDSTGNVLASNKPYFLSYAPDGWDGIAIQNVRNKKYWGIDRTVSAPLSYVQDGAQILKYIFYTLGIEEPVYLVIAKQEIDYTAGVSYGFWYKQIYRGEVDLSTLNHSGSKVTCTTLEDGLPKYLKSNEATVYEFPMNVAEAISVKMDGIILTEKANYQDVDQLQISSADYTNYFEPMSYIGKEGDNVGMLFDSQELQNVNGLSWAAKLALTNCLLTNTNTYAVDIVVSGVIEFTSVLNGSTRAFKIRYLTSDQTVANQNNYEVFTFTGLGLGGTFTQSFSKEIRLQPGARLFREGVFIGSSTAAGIITYTTNSKSSIKFKTRRETSFIKAFKPQYLFFKLIEKLTEGNFEAVRGNYLSINENKVFTCGNAIRGLEDAVLKISFNDFFQFWDSYDSVGISVIGRKVNINTKPDLVDESDVVLLAEPSNLKISIAKDYLFNELEVGYPEIKNEIGALNGNQEFNCKFLFSTGTTKAPAKMDKVSKIKASCYEIELIRATTLAKDTTDNKADNDLFVLHVEDNQQQQGTPAAHYKLSRSLNTGATGLIEPDTVFNIELSPKRNLIRNGAFIRSSLYLSDSKVLGYKSADKNNSMVANGLIEKADLLIGSLGSQFFYPVLFDMDVPAPENLLEILDLNPLKIFKFPFYGDFYYGLLVKVSISPSNRKEQAYQLMALPASNLQKLILYHG